MSLTPISATNTGGQRNFFNKYPYTDFHELNLDWILENYQAIIDKLNETIEWANNHQIDYEEAIARLTAVEGEIDTFEAQITAAFDQLQADLEADFAQQKSEMEAVLDQTVAEVDAKILQLTDEVEAAIASFDYQFEVLKNQILLTVDQLKAEVRQEIANFYNVMEANNQYVFQYVENRLDEFINSFPEILTVYVYNPYRGEVTDIQTAVNDLYSVAAIWGLTAMQYDSLQLTAQEYDDMSLTASEYDTLGYKLLYKDPDNYMLSPFTGEYVPIKSVVYDLASLHSSINGLTATGYDTLELTAEDYDAYEMTAFQYDWYAKEILTA